MFRSFQNTSISSTDIIYSWKKLSKAAFKKLLRQFAKLGLLCLKAVWRASCYCSLLPTSRQRESERRMCQIMEPTTKGVWWKDDKQWVLYSAEDAAKILRAKVNGDPSVTLGPVKSPRHPSGTNYAIDLLTMKQKNLSTGFLRDIKIVAGSDQEEDEKESAERGGSCSSDNSNIKSDKVKAATRVERGKDIVSIVPTVTVDLQSLAAQCTLDEQCNMVLKLPKTVVQSDRLSSLTRKTLVLLLEKLTRKEFIEEVVLNKIQRSQDSFWGWSVEDCDPYVVGRVNSEMHSLFLDYLCKLAEEDDAVVDEIYKVAENGFTAEGERIQYVFRSCSEGEWGNIRSRVAFKPVGSESGGYTRKVPLPKQGTMPNLCVYLTMTEFVQGKCYIKGAVLPIAMCAVRSYVEDAI